MNNAMRVARNAGAALALAAMSMLVHAQGSSGDPRTVVIAPVQAPMAAVTVPVSNLRVSTWLDRPNRTYYVTGAGQPADTLTIYFRTNADAYVTVVASNAKGEVHRLFPNQYAPDNFVKGGKTYAIPAPGETRYRLAIAEPLGVDLIRVFATDKRVEIVDERSLMAAGPFAQFRGDPAAMARTVNVAATANPTVSWAAAEERFSIVSSGGVATLPAGTPAPALGPTPTTVPTPMPTLMPAPTPYPVMTTPSDFGFELKTDKPQYRVDEKITVIARPERRCQLVLLDVDATGKYKLLLPTALDKTEWLSAGKTHFLAGSRAKFEIRAGAPGANSLVAVCSANRTFGQFMTDVFGGGRHARADAVVRRPTREEALAKQPTGDTARAVAVYTVIQRGKESRNGGRRCCWQRQRR